MFGGPSCQLGQSVHARASRPVGISEEERKEREESCLKVCKSFPEDETEEQKVRSNIECVGGYYLGTTCLSTIH